MAPVNSRVDLWSYCSSTFCRGRRLSPLGSLILSLLLVLRADSFNIDTKAPIFKHGQRSSYFGFSLAQHYVTNQATGIVSPFILVGAPRDNVTSPEAAEEVRNLVRPGVIYQCPFTSNTDDCDDIKVDREAPSDSEDKNDQWLGVSVASQGTDDGSAMVCAHRYKLSSAYYRWGVGQCVSLTNALDEDQYYQPCEGLPRSAGHGEYGFCQAGISVTLSKSGDLLMGAPGPYNWRGVLFKNQLEASLDEENNWVPSPVEDPTANYPGPEPATGYYSYLGMSVKIATLAGQQWYIGGAPRSKLLGQVFLFQQKPGSKTLSIEHRYVLTGQQFGAGFGYDIAVGDFNLDQKEDLVVAAPFYHAPGVGGAIYIYMNSDEGITALTVPQIIYSRKMKDQECSLLSCQNARFGFAIAPIGDVDRDGFPDLAVGAPYEGSGAVYIFRGSAQGLIPEYSQRIAASEFTGHQLGAFGAALAGGADMDNNGYPDLAIGAFSSDKIVVLRARPVVNIEVEIIATPSLVDPQQKTCEQDGSANICFQLNVCFRFSAEPRERFNKKLEVFYRLDSETFSSSKLARAVFVREQRGKSVENAVIESSVTMKEQAANMTQAFVCETRLAYIAKTNRDFLNPIMLQLTYRLKDYGNPMLTPGQALGDINVYPVLNSNLAKVNYSIDFKKNCGSDHQCHSSLSVDATLSLKRDQSNYILRVGQTSVAVLNVDINNAGEDAHESSLIVTLPESIDYLGTDSLKGDQIYTCSPVANVIHCSIANPLAARHGASLSIRLDMANTAPSSEPINITVQANTTSIEMNTLDDRVVLSLIVIVESDLLVLGRSDPVQVVFGGEVVGESAIEFEERIGAEVIHTFEVRNAGSASVPKCQLFISWPYETSSGQHVLYLLGEPVIMDGSDARGYCNYDPSWINPLGIRSFSSRPVPPIAVVGDRSRRSTDDEPAAARVARGTKKVAKLSCDDQSARCHVFKCEIGKLEPKHGVALKFRSRLWNSTFLENYALFDEVRISSRIEVKIDPSSNIKQSNLHNDIHFVETVAIPDILVYSPGVPLWIIIVSIIAGIILLTLVIVILWRCGFFRRQRTMGTHKAEKKHGVEDYHD